MGNRFQQLLKTLGFKSNVAFAEHIKSSEGKVRDIIKGRVKTISPEILEFLISKNVNLNWLFTGIGGEGEMFLIGGSTSLTNRDVTISRAVEANAELSEDEREIVEFLRENPRHKKVIDWLRQNSQEAKNEAIRYILDLKNG